MNYEEAMAKPEEMTHLRGTVLVPKTHPRIELRGKLDSLMAQILAVQLTAEEKGEAEVLRGLEELYSLAGNIMAAEVKEEPLGEFRLLGMDSAQLRHASHDVKGTFGIDHPRFDRSMGRLCVELNRLRTQARETELAAARAFRGEGKCLRPDLLEALNRMSSGIYVILCKKLSQKLK